jgi:hypothetical protein
VRALVPVLFLVAPSVVAAPAPFPRSERRSDSDGDLARLQGIWTLDATYRWQEDAWMRIHTAAHPLVIRGRCFAWQGSFAPLALVERFTLHKGRGIDFISPDAGGVEHAAYAVEGDTLTIALPFSGAERASLERGKYKLVYRRKR